MNKEIKIGIIGGSGLEKSGILKDAKEIKIETPYGAPSENLLSGEIAGQTVVLLNRHGKDHNIMPTKVPFRANIWAFKEIGCTHILATTACGSLNEEMRPNDFVFIDQFIDFTKHRQLTFFEDKVIHTAMAEPFCKDLRKILINTANHLHLRCHSAGIMLTIEGPRFSTKAESWMFKKLGADLVNMSTVPAVILAREIGLPYQAIAMVTDYDCWKEYEAPVTWEMIVERVKLNADNVIKLLAETIPKINFTECECRKTASEVKI